ncbi:hypothetical protein GEMRC1_004567 [Eukaryota sp. GEM-RC1]
MQLQAPDAESVVYIAYFKFSNSIVGCDCLYVDNLQVFPAVYVFLTVNDTAHGSLESDPVQLVAINSDSNEIHVNPVFGYELSYWLINGTDVLTSDPLVIKNVHGNTTAEAFFQLKTYSVDIQSSVGGSTDPQGSQQVAHGDSLIVTAIPDHGYVFIQWSDTNDENPRTIDDVQADLAISPEFTLVVYTIDIQSSVGGSTDPQAISDHSYVFIQWNDEIVDNPRTIQDVQADLVFSAEFEEDSSEYFLILGIVLLIVILVIFGVLGILKFGSQKPDDKHSTTSLQCQELSEVLTFTAEDQEPPNLENLVPDILPIVVEVEPDEQIDQDGLSQHSIDDNQSDDNQSNDQLQSTLGNKYAVWSVVDIEASQADEDSVCDDDGNPINPEDFEKKANQVVVIGNFILVVHEASSNTPGLQFDRADEQGVVTNPTRRDVMDFLDTAIELTGDYDHVYIESFEIGPVYDLGNGRKVRNLSLFTSS